MGNDESPKVQLGTPRPLVADGLILRPWEPSDVDVLIGLDADELLQTWNPFLTWKSRDEALERIERARAWADYAVWAITDAESGVVVGDMVLHHLDATNASAELGYTVFADYRGRGIAARAITAVCGFVFDELELERIELFHAIENTQSCQAALKAGFIVEGTLRKSFRYGDGELHDEHVHSRLRTD